MDRSRLTNLERSRFEKERTHYDHMAPGLQGHGHEDCLWP